MRSFIISLVVISTGVHGQPIGNIDYSIREKSVTVSLASPRIVIHTELMNRSDHDFILPGFRNTFVMPGSEDFSWESDEDKNGGGVNIFFLLNGNGDRVKVWEDIVENHEDTASLTSSLRQLYVGNQVYLRRREKLELQLVIDLSKTGPLETGEYSLYMIYSSGRLAAEVVGSHKGQIPNASRKAIVFEGYVKSNCARLVIR